MGWTDTGNKAGPTRLIKNGHEERGRTKKEEKLARLCCASQQFTVPTSEEAGRLF